MIARLALRAFPSVLLCLSTLPHASAQEVSLGKPGETDCGVCALYAILRLEGVEADVPSILKALPAPAAEGRSMKDLREAAAGLGLPLDCIRLRDDLRSLDRPMIALLRGDEGGHFVVLRPVGHTGNLIQVIDGGREPSVEDGARISVDPSWTGFVLAPRDRMRGWFLPALISIPLAFSSILLVGRYRRIQYGRDEATTNVEDLC
jgi:hypothetical protein